MSDLPGQRGYGKDVAETAWYHVAHIQGFAVVTAGGDVDARTVQQFHHAVTEAAGMSSRMVIDLGHVTFIDSTGLGVLIAARNQAQQRGAGVALVSPPPMVRRLLTTTQLQHLFTVHDRLADAITTPTSQ